MSTAVMPAPRRSVQTKASSAPARKRKPTFNQDMFSQDTAAIGQLAGKVSQPLSGEAAAVLRESLKDRYGLTSEELSRLIAMYRNGFSDSRSGAKNGPGSVRTRLEAQSRVVLSNWEEKGRPA